MLQHSRTHHEGNTDHGRTGLHGSSTKPECAGCLTICDHNYSVLKHKNLENNAVNIKNQWISFSSMIHWNNNRNMKENISTLEEGMIYIFLIGSRLCHTICFLFIYIRIIHFTVECR